VVDALKVGSINWLKSINLRFLIIFLFQQQRSIAGYVSMTKKEKDQKEKQRDEARNQPKE
jgi:hypothetical protein